MKKVEEKVARKYNRNIIIIILKLYISTCTYVCLYVCMYIRVINKVDRYRGDKATTSLTRTRVITKGSGRKKSHKL